MDDEFQLIKYIKNLFSSHFIGDDAAVIPLNDNNNLVISKDILIENIHFIVNDNMLSVGKKALISNISDIIAMGVEPKFFFLGLGIPKSIKEEKINEFLNGLQNISEKYNIILCGGDTSTSENFFISITILGFGEKDKIVYRNSAKTGDDIWITGEFGDSEIGLRLIKKI